MGTAASDAPRETPSEIVSPRDDAPRRVRVKKRTKRTRLGRLRRRIKWRWVLLAVVVALVALAADYWFEYRPALRAIEDGKAKVLQAKQLLTGDLAHLDKSRVDQALQLLKDAHDDFGSRSQALQDGLLVRAGDHLPWISTQVDAARALRTAGSAGTAFGVDLTALVAQVASPPAGQPASPFQQVIAVADQNQAALATAVADLDTFRTALAQVPTGSLWGPLSSARDTAVSEGNRVIGAAGPSLEIFRALPSAVGPGDHRYLLLLENPGEERPGGGFIGAVGEMDFHDGAISAETFKGGEAYTDLTPKSLKAPGPLDANLFKGTPWDLEDANWSPDFPTAVAQVTHFYQLATGRTVDGVISVDPVALAYVMQVSGSLTVPGYPDDVMTSSNILLDLNYITNKARPGDPGKAFLPPFGAAITTRLFHAPLGQLPALATALNNGATEKHIVLWFSDPKLEKLVADAGYGGLLGAPLSDSLMVNDANLSGTKGDLFVTRHFSLAANVASDGSVQDTLTLTYQNPAQTGANAALEPGSGGDYRDYIQVIVPETATLGSLTVAINGGAAASVAPASVSYDLQRETIAYWLVVPHGGSATVTVQYSGPFADISQTPEQYQLVWQKQVNSLTWPVDVAVAMPGEPARHFSANLDRDVSWSVHS